MKNAGLIILIVVVIILIGVGVWYLYFKDKPATAVNGGIPLGGVGQPPKSDGKCNSGLAIVNGKCAVAQATTSSSQTGGLGQAPNLFNPKCNGALVLKNGTCQEVSKPSENAYIDPVYRGYDDGKNQGNWLYIYNSPAAPYHDGRTVIGVHPLDWMPNLIGTVIKVYNTGQTAISPAEDFYMLGGVKGDGGIIKVKDKGTTVYVDSNAIINTPLRRSNNR